MRDVVTPPESSLMRPLYEQAYQAGDESLARYVSVAGQIETVRRSLWDQASPDAFMEGYVEHHKSWLTDYTEQQLAYMQQAEGTAGDALLLRTQLVTALLDQMVCIPRLFNYPADASRKWRQELVETEGIYGAICEVLECAYSHFQPERHDHQTRELVGFMTETAGLALTNYRQIHNEVGLPTLAYGDLLRGRDIRLYLFIGNVASTRRIQVKSDGYRLSLSQLQSTTPLIVGGIALGNSSRSEMWPERRPQQTTEAIIAQNAGLIDDKREHTLSGIAAGLGKALRGNQHFVAKGVLNSHRKPRPYSRSHTVRSVAADTL